MHKFFEYYKNNSNIEIVTGNMEMDAVMLLQKFEKEYPNFAPKLKEKLNAWGGNSAGNRLGNMDWLGNVKPDPFFPITIGNYLEKDFDKVWLDKNNELITKLRQSPRNISGKCSDCKYLDICNGGSRSRAYAITGDLWSEDPSCYLYDSEIN